MCGDEEWGQGMREGSGSDCSAGRHWGESLQETGCIRGVSGTLKALRWGMGVRRLQAALPIRGWGEVLVKSNEGLTRAQMVQK